MRVLVLVAFLAAWSVPVVAEEPKWKPLYPLKYELVRAPVHYQFLMDHPRFNEVANLRSKGLDEEASALRSALSSPPPENPGLLVNDRYDRAHLIGTIRQRHERDEALPALFLLPQNLTARNAVDSWEARGTPLHQWAAAKALVTLGKLAPQAAILKRLEGDVALDPDLRLMAFVLYELDGPRLGLFRLEEEIDKTKADPRAGWITGRKNKLANLLILKEWFTTKGFFQDPKNHPKYTLQSDDANLPNIYTSPELREKVYAELNERRRALGLETAPTPDKPQP